MGRQSHFVGRVEAGRAVDLFSKGVEADANAPDGAIVEVRGTRTETLAEPDSAESRLYAIAAKSKLDPVFPQAVEEQVAVLVQEPGLDDPGLADFRDWPFVTIDGATSMDLDQAAFVEPDGEGHVVHYALADAAYYVQPGTPLHAEALRRGASYYLPGVMVPMLPRALSEGLVSLNPDVDRRSVVFSMTLDGEGVCTKTIMRRARIRSRGKLSFGGVQAFYDGGAGFSPAIDASLRELAKVGLRRMNLAEARGVVRYRRRSVSAKLDGGGVRFTATSEVRRMVERYNEQLSLLCNIEGARALQESSGDHVEPIYRAHPPPSDDKMRSFEKLLLAIVEAHGLDAGTWAWTRKSDVPLSRFLDELPEDGPHAQVASAIHRQAIMANVRSMFQTEAAGHHGVGAEVYARFSAPMREIVGVFLHSELMQALAGSGHQDAELRARVVERANASKGVQRAITNEANRLVLDQIFKDAGERALPGVLMGVQGDKAYVRLDTPPIDVKVYLRGRPGRLRVGQGKATLCRDEQVVHRVGDAVSLRVDGKDEKRNRWYLDFV